MIEETERNYLGFTDKTKDTFFYNSFKDQLKVEANAKESSCFEVLKKYTSFFRDGHIYFFETSTSNENGVTSLGRIL